MPDTFFIEEYRKKSLDKNPLYQSGRSIELEPLNYLHIVRHVLDLLELEKSHDLLDIGCANGMFDIIISACCNKLVAIDPVPELVEMARKNLSIYSNTSVRNGHASDIPASDNAFDRVLMLETLQLIPENEIINVFHEISRVTRSAGRVLIGAVPDISKKEEFLDKYLADIRNATHLSETEKMDIIRRNERANWYDKSRLKSIIHDMKHSAEFIPLDPNLPNYKYRFNIILTIK